MTSEASREAALDRLVLQYLEKKKCVNTLPMPSPSAIKCPPRNARQPFCMDSMMHQHSVSAIPIVCNR